MKNYYDIVSKWFKDEDIFIKDMTNSNKVKEVKVNGSKTYYLKQKQSIDEVEKELYLHRILSKHNVPTSVHLVNKDNCIYTRDNDEIYCLYESLPGKYVSDLYDRGQAYMLGEAISRLHLALIHCDTSEINIKQMNIKEQLTEWAIPESIAIDNRVKDIKEYLSRNLFANIDSLPKQIIHRDPHPQNILFENDQLSGFIDFDISTIGLRIFDICYCSTAILMGSFSNQSLREQWFNVLSHLIKGYMSNIQLNDMELKAIVAVLLSIQLIFSAYFKGKNDDIARINLDGLLWIYDNRHRIEKMILKDL